MPTAVVQLTLPFLFNFRHDPKSASFMWPSLSMSTLSGFISLREEGGGGGGGGWEGEVREGEEEEEEGEEEEGEEDGRRKKER